MARAPLSLISRLPLSSPCRQQARALCHARLLDHQIHALMTKTQPHAPSSVLRIARCKPGLALQVFSEVAARVVGQALEGFNGTVFAYGSTGSGKTFTITGGMQRYEDRGLVPRAISHAFNTMAERPSHAYQVLEPSACFWAGSLG